MMKFRWCMKRPNKFILFNLFIIILSAFVSIQINADTSIPVNGAKYLLKSWEYEIIDGTFIEKVSLKITIYNTLGEQYNRVYFYENNSSQVDDVSLSVLNTDGSILYKREKKNFIKQCGYGAFGGYNDNCIYFLDAEATHFPYTIEFSYTKKCNSLLYLTGEKFQEDIPVERVSYKIFNYDNSVIHYKLYGDSTLPIESYLGDGVSYEWELNDLPALTSISYLPADAREEIKLKIVCENLAFNEYALPEVSWQGIGLWYNQLLIGKFNTPPDSDTLSIEEIYNTVINNVRYVAIEIGIGGWQPYDAVLTETRKFGDCKDMSTLLISRLRNQNYQAFPVLVLTRDNGRIDKNFPSLTFNHAITVAIHDNDTIWMDPTCNSCAFGELPGGDKDIDVLVITEDGGKIRRTPKDRPEDNQLIRNTKISIGSDRSISIVSRSVLFGQNGRGTREYLSDKSENEKSTYLERYLNRKETIFKLDSFQFENEDLISEPFVMEIKSTTLKPVDKIGNKWYINPFISFREKNLTKVKTTERIYPINLGFPYEVIDTILIELDSTIAIDSVVLHNSDSVVTKDLAFYSDIKSTENGFCCIVSFYRNSYQIDPENFSEYELFYKKIKEITSQYIKLFIS